VVDSRFSVRAFLEKPIRCWLSAVLCAFLVTGCDDRDEVSKDEGPIEMECVRQPSLAPEVVDPSLLTRLPPAERVEFVFFQRIDSGGFRTLPTSNFDFGLVERGYHSSRPSANEGFGRAFGSDLAPVSATGSPTIGKYRRVSIEYNNMAVPNGQPADQGLNRRLLLALARVRGAGLSGKLKEQVQLLRMGPIGSKFCPLDESEARGGWIRVYVDLVGGKGLPYQSSDAASKTAIPFSPSDELGIYSGLLTVKAEIECTPQSHTCIRSSARTIEIRVQLVQSGPQARRLSPTTMPPALPDSVALSAKFGSTHLRRSILGQTTVASTPSTR